MTAGKVRHSFFRDGTALARCKQRATPRGGKGEPHRPTAGRHWLQVRGGLHSAPTCEVPSPNGGNMQIGWTDTVYSGKFEICPAPRVGWSKFKSDKLGLIYLWKLART